MQPPPRKRRLLPILGLLALSFFSCVIGYGIGSSGRSTAATPTTTQAGQAQATTAQQATATHTPTPTPAPQKHWQVTHTFQGNGAKKTETFTVGSDWKISWSCQGDVANNIDAPLYINVYNQDGGLTDSPNTTCKATAQKTIGETEEHAAGSYYLDINSGIDWTIKDGIPYYVPALVNEVKDFVSKARAASSVSSAGKGASTVQ